MDFTFAVPTGSAAGDELKVVTSDGLVLRTQLPEGAAPGRVCKVKAPREAPVQPTVVATEVGSATYEATVPAHATAGTVLRAVRPLGRRAVAVEVPAGAEPGSKVRFKVEWPRDAIE